MVRVLPTALVANNSNKAEVVNNKVAEEIATLITNAGTITAKGAEAEIAGTTSAVISEVIEIEVIEETAMVDVSRTIIKVHTMILTKMKPILTSVTLT
jgi:hypothetical protein